MKKENGGPAFPAASVPVELSDDLLWKWFKESLKRRGLHDFDFCVLRDVADKAAAYGREQAVSRSQSGVLISHDAWAELAVRHPETMNVLFGGQP